MWNPNWIADFNRSKKPTTEKVDWGAAAQEWLKNKELYENWQQQQYQQHMQVMAAQAVQVVQSIDPSITSNPPPPPSENATPHPFDNEKINLLKRNDELSEHTEKINTNTEDQKNFSSFWNNYESFNWTNHSWQTQSTLHSPLNYKQNPKLNIPSIKVPSLKLVPKLIDSKNTEMRNEANVEKVFSDKKNSFLEINHSSFQPDKSIKQLPLWIRDGLANIEKAKQKKFEKNDKNQNIDHNDITNISFNIEISVDPCQEEKKINDPTTIKSKILKLSDIEKQELQINIIKSLITEILLDVTNIHMKLIAIEVYEKVSAQARSIKKTSALNMIAAETNNESETDTNENSDDEDIKMLKAKGEKKLYEYEKKYKEISRVYEIDSKIDDINLNSKFDDELKQSLSDNLENIESLLIYKENLKTIFKERSKSSSSTSSNKSQKDYKILRKKKISKSRSRSLERKYRYNDSNNNKTEHSRDKFEPYLFTNLKKKNSCSKYNSKKKKKYSKANFLSRSRSTSKQPKSPNKHPIKKSKRKKKSKSRSRSK